MNNDPLEHAIANSIARQKQLEAMCAQFSKEMEAEIKRRQIQREKDRKDGVMTVVE